MDLYFVELCHHYVDGIITDEEFNARSASRIAALTPKEALAFARAISEGFPLTGNEGD